MSRSKQNRIYYVSSKNIPSIRFFKEKVFEGNIFIFDNIPLIKKTLMICDPYFINFFKIPIKVFLNISNSDINNLNGKFKDIQERLKENRLLSRLWSDFFKKLGFDLSDTYLDKVCLRFSPNIDQSSIGNLKPTLAHRDTWASNLYHQINWWMPLHDVQDNNSIFIAIDYFKKKVENNSKDWKYRYLRKKNNYPSTPFSNIKLTNKEKINLKLKIGQIACFSGHHIHGSNVGSLKRLNIETRTVCYNDLINYKIPENLDSYGKKRFRWFRNILNNKSYSED